METVIKVNASEFNSAMLEKIQKFIGNKNNVDITISLREFETLDRSIDQAESGSELITMTMEAFETYIPKKEAMRNVAFTPIAFEEYNNWFEANLQMISRIKTMIRDMTSTRSKALANLNH